MTTGSSHPASKARVVRSQYPSSMLMDQLRSQQTPSHTATAAVTPPHAHSRDAASSAIAAPIAALVHDRTSLHPDPSTTIDLSLLSFDDWLQFKTAWLTTRRHMYWQIYGIATESTTMDARREPKEMIKDGEMGVSREEKSAVMPVSSPLAHTCRTSFSPSDAAHLLPSQRRIAGIAMQLDDEAIVYRLRVGSELNRANPDGPDGDDMWEAFWYEGEEDTRTKLIYAYIM